MGLFIAFRAEWCAIAAQFLFENTWACLPVLGVASIAPINPSFPNAKWQPMFSKILRKVIGRNKDVDTFLKDDDKDMLAGTVDDVFKGMEDVMDGLDADQIEQLKAQFEDGLADSLAEMGPALADTHADILGDARKLLAKWRWRVACGGQDVSFDVLSDISAELAKVKSEGRDFDDVDKELQALLRQDEAARSELIQTIQKNEDQLLDQVEAVLDDGGDANERTFLMDSPLGYAYESHRFDVMQLLVEYGAEPDAVGWDALHTAIAWGSADDVRNALPSPIMNRPDEEKRTALDLATLIGDEAKLEILRAAGATSSED